MVQQVYKGKCVIVGDSAVGKTSLISCFVEHKFPNDYLPTIGTNLYVKQVIPEKNVSFQLTCWDIAGDQKFGAMRRLYYKGATGAFIVADLTRPETFESIKKNWIKDLTDFCPNIPIILLANKDDLESVIKDDYIACLKEDFNVLEVYRTSAKTSKNVNDAFLQIVKEMMEKR